MRLRNLGIILFNMGMLLRFSVGFQGKSLPRGFGRERENLRSAAAMWHTHLEKLGVLKILEALFLLSLPVVAQQQRNKHTVLV